MAQGSLLASFYGMRKGGAFVLFRLLPYSFRDTDHCNRDEMVAESEHLVTDAISAALDPTLGMLLPTLWMVFTLI